MSKNKKSEKKMFINKTENGKNNICGTRITKYRKEKKMSQRALADKLQLAGLNVDKNAVQRMESGQRFITDIELTFLCAVLEKSLNQLFGLEP